MHVSVAQVEYYSKSANKGSSGLQPLKTPVSQVPTLLKLGVTLPILRQSSFTGYYAMLAVDATVEQKLKNGLALNGGLQMNAGVSLDGRGAQFYSLEMPVALRYYFSLTRKERQRPDPHSFFSSYVALQTQNMLVSNLTYPVQMGLGDLQRYQRGDISRAITNNGNVGDRFIWLDYAFVQLGRQFQVAEKYYLDANVMIPVSALIYNQYDYTLATPAIVNVKFGIAKWRK